MNRKEIITMLEELGNLVPDDMINDVNTSKSMKKSMLLNNLSEIHLAERLELESENASEEELEVLSEKQYQEKEELQGRELNKIIKKQDKQIKKLEDSSSMSEADEILLNYELAMKRDVIDVKDFTLLYKKGEYWQKEKRKLSKDPLPTIGQKAKKDGSLVGKKSVRSVAVRYAKKDIEPWLERNGHHSF